MAGGVTNLTHTEVNLTTTVTYTGTVGSQTYRGATIYWGDSTTTPADVYIGTHTYSHTYANAGTYHAYIRHTLMGNEYFDVTVPHSSGVGVIGPGGSWPPGSGTSGVGGSQRSVSSGVVYDGNFY